VNNRTLEALRRLLFFSRAEAATLVAACAKKPHGVTDRSWLWWEQGTRPIPAHVSDKIRYLATWRNDLIEAASRRKKINLVWFDSLDDWQALNHPPILFRPYLSAVASLAALRPQLPVTAQDKTGPDLVLADAIALWLVYEKSLSGGRQQADE
jgi:hypothetical protein